MLSGLDPRIVGATLGVGLPILADLRYRVRYEPVLAVAGAAAILCLLDRDAKFAQGVAIGAGVMAVAVYQQNKKEDLLAYMRANPSFKGA